jgi:hypothetical protein
MAKLQLNANLTATVEQVKLLRYANAIRRHKQGTRGRNWEATVVNGNLGENLSSSVATAELVLAGAN